MLEELGRDDEAEEWHRRAEVAEDALNAANGSDGDLEVVLVEEVVEQFVPEDADEEAAASEGQD